MAEDLLGEALPGEHGERLVGAGEEFLEPDPVRRGGPVGGGDHRHPRGVESVPGQLDDALPEGWGRPPAGGEAFWLLGLFAASVGLPFVALAGNGRVHAIAGDTDGVDGAAEVAGAVIGPDTLARALAQGIVPADSLAANDGHGFFEALGDQVVTGPTLTNVNDFRAILIEAA